MIVVDTTELTRHTQRKLHAAGWELKGKQLLATPSEIPSFYHMK